MITTLEATGAQAVQTTSTEVRPNVGVAPTTTTLPARLDIHILDQLQPLCQENISRDLLLDASAVSFIDTAALAFLENLDTVHRTAGATVHYVWPSPATVATFELHGSKLCGQVLMFP
jgi:anti-anti-sigma regulatory factor